MERKRWKLRVSFKTVSPPDAVAFIQKYGGEYSYCFEDMDTDNPHMHAYLHTSVLEATMRDNLRRLDPKHDSKDGNKLYSLKQVKRCELYPDEDFPIEYVAYMMKQQYFKGNLNSIDTEKAEVHQTRVRADFKIKKEAKKNVVEKIMKLIDEDPRYVKHLENFPNSEPENYTIIECIFEYYRQNKLQVRKFSMKSQYDTIRVNYKYRCCEATGTTPTHSEYYDWFV